MDNEMLRYYKQNKAEDLVDITFEAAIMLRLPFMACPNNLDTTKPRQRVGYEYEV